jgi:NAD+ synthase (glutamine-hydrolysing)
VKLTIALAQIYPKLGSLRVNLNKHLSLLSDAKAQGAELVIFPELSLTGYFLQDLLYEVALQPTANDPVFGELLEATARLEIDAVVGFAEIDARGKYYISAAYLSRGDVLHVHRKVYLPTYGMFIDGRFFSPGDGVRAFDTRFGRVGLLICEDFWHVSSPYLLWLDGADMLIFPTDSPGRGMSIEPELGSARWAEKLVQTYAGLFGSPILYCNRVGFEDGINFFGGSMVANADGGIAAQAQPFDETLLIHQVDLDCIRRSRATQPFLRDENTDLVARELGRILSPQVTR